MNLLESLRIAIRALGANKGRAALTMLGVIIGVGSVILLVAIGTGVQQEVTGSIEGLGSNLIFAFPGNVEQGGGAMSVKKPFKLEDAETLTRRVVGAEAVIPLIQAPALVEVGSKSIRTIIAAGNEKGGEVFTSDLLGGRMYNRGEVAAGSRVVMLGATVRDQLFPNKDPLGETVIINGQRFTVIAHFAKQGGALSGDQDNQIYMPVTTAQKLLGTDEISAIVIKADEIADVDTVRAQIRRALEPRFGDDFSVFTQEQTLGVLSTLLDTLTVMLAGIAGISLLVGGIGIMNIMLVSVSERTREIGIRKAVGARTYDIMSQFVIEAITLSVSGGMVGIAIGWSAAAVIDRWVPTQVTPWAVALAFTFSAAVGIFFGVYPAWKASRLDPIMALRYE